MESGCEMGSKDPAFLGLRLGLGLGLVLRLTLAFITGAIVAGANVVHSKQTDGYTWDSVNFHYINVMEEQNNCFYVLFSLYDVEMFLH